MALSLGNVAHQLSTPTVTISTAGTSGVLVLVNTINASVQQTPSVASTTLGSWDARAYKEAAGANFASITLFTAPFSSALVSEVITYTLGAGTIGGVMTTDVFEISGCALSSYYDTNVNFPIQSNSYPISINTSNANDFIISAYRGDEDTHTAGSGWTLISGGPGFQYVQYQIVSATQSGLSATTTGGTPNTGIADAIIALGGGVGSGTTTYHWNETISI